MNREFPDLPAMCLWRLLLKKKEFETKGSWKTHEDPAIYWRDVLREVGKIRISCLFLPFEWGTRRIKLVSLVEVPLQGLPKPQTEISRISSRGPFWTPRGDTAIFTILSWMSPLYLEGVTVAPFKYPTLLPYTPKNRWEIGVIFPICHKSSPLKKLQSDPWVP